MNGCDINHSKAFYTIEQNSIRMPLQVLKGVGKTIYPTILEHAPYADLFDFLAKASMYKINESTIRILIDGGALDCFGYNRATLNENLRKLIDYVNIVRIEDPNNLRFDFSIVSRPGIQRIKENPIQKAQKEQYVYGFYVSEHPVQSLRMHNYPNCIPLLNAVNKDGYMNILVRVASFRTHKTKKGDWMCFMSVEDEAGKMDAVIMPRLYEQQKENIQKDRICLIQGKKDRPSSIVVNKLEKYKLERDCFYADYYLMSTNAMTEDGILVNMDGHCNRVSCLCFGPRHVIMIVGMNKVTKDLDSAISRLRNVAAPINSQRFAGNRPCQVTGSCANCLAQGCICDQLVITRNSMEPDRIHVILVDEVLGY